MVQFLDDGYVVAIVIGYYTMNPYNYFIHGAHMIVIYGYVVVNGIYMFMIRDPGPVNEGSTYLSTYSNLVYKYDESSSYYTIWNSCIVRNTEYAYDTIPYYLDR